MKGKKFVIIASIALLIFSILGILIIHEYLKCEIITNLLYGVFGSSFVTLIIFITEYFVEKGKMLETIFFCTEKIIKEFKKIHYCKIPKEIEIISKYYHEEFNNKGCEDYGQEPSQVHFDKLVQYYKDNISEYWWGDVEVDKKAVEIAREKTDSLRVELEKAINSYLNIDNEVFKKMTVELGNFHLFYKKGKLNNLIFTNIYKHSNECHNEIIKANYHFNLYRNNEGGSLAIMIDYIQKLQSMFFRTTEETKGDYHNISVYAKVVRELDLVQYKLLEYINHKMSDLHDEKPIWFFSNKIDNQN